MKKILILSLFAQSLCAQMIMPLPASRLEDDERMMRILKAPPEDKLRIIMLSGSVLKVGVSTAKFQFGLQTSTNRVHWEDAARTWILSGSTNEIVISLPLPPGQSFIRISR